MPQFSIDKLVVLHLYNYTKPKGEPDPLRSVERNCQVIKLSTCMRVIYVSNTDLMNEGSGSSYEQLKESLGKKDKYSSSIKFERLEGQAAYQFLLYWIIGGLNPKNPFDDVRIKGDVRGIWAKLLRSTSQHNKQLVPIYRNFFDQFFTDSAKISKLIEVYRGLEQKEFESRLMLVCRNCAWARSNGFLSKIASLDYRHFADDTYIEELRLKLEKSKTKLMGKAEISSPRSGSEVVFFKSNYEVTPAKLKSITEHLQSIDKLLALLTNLRKDKPDELIEADIESKESTGSKQLF